MEETKNLTLNETPLAEEPEKEEALSDRVRVISPGRMVLKRFFRSKLSVIGLCLMLFLFLFSFIGPLFTGWEQNEIDRSIRQVVYSPSQLTDDCYYVGEVENTVAKLAPPASRALCSRRYFRRWYLASCLSWLFNHVASNAVSHPYSVRSGARFAGRMTSRTCVVCRSGLK